jgi:hypothetical protein
MKISFSLEQRVQSFVEKYIDYLLENGHHPNMSEMMKFSGSHHNTILRYFRIIEAKKWGEIVEHGNRRVLIFPGVYFVDERGK